MLPKSAMTAGHRAAARDLAHERDKARGLYEALRNLAQWCSANGRSGAEPVVAAYNALATASKPSHSTESGNTK